MLQRSQDSFVSTQYGLRLDRFAVAPDRTGAMGMTGPSAFLVVRWPSGQAQVCKTCYGGSIPPRTSNLRHFAAGASFRGAGLL
jgi:hypothetical protein